MGVEKPVVRHFVACREIIVNADGSITLQELIHSIMPVPGESYPCVRDRMALFALLTNGRGRHEIALELTRFHEGQEHQVVRTSGRTIDLGPDPIAVLGLPIPIRNVLFHEPGQYAFHLLCDGESVAEEKLLLR